jgi:amidohydrolase
MAAPKRLKVRPQVHALAGGMLAVRRDLHAHPELSWKETRTQAAILERLTALAIDDVRPIARTGATALVRGGKTGPCVAWRADTDALPIPERNGLPFASTVEGVMHACGHDFHVAVALALAEALALRRSDLAGSVRFVFQPAEEASGGAEQCIADGVLERPEVERVLGLHVSADVPIGAINVAPGPFFAAPTAFRVEIKGLGGHAAAPHQSVDAVVVAAHVITALQTVVSRSLPPSDQGVLTVGKVEAGYRGNVIAESATLTGTVRSYNDRVRDLLTTRAAEIVAGVCQAFGATGTFTHRTTCPPVVNDTVVTATVLDEAAEFFGPENIYAAPSMGADDMSLFLEARPGCYFWLGARNEAKGIAGRHHDPGFMVDEDALELGAEFGLRVIEASLNGG